MLRLRWALLARLPRPELPCGAQQLAAGAGFASKHPPAAHEELANAEVGGLALSSAP